MADPALTRVATGLIPTVERAKPGDVLGIERGMPCEMTRHWSITEEDEDRRRRELEDEAEDALVPRSPTRRSPAESNRPFTRKMRRTISVRSLVPRRAAVAHFFKSDNQFPRHMTTGLEQIFESRSCFRGGQGQP